MSTMSEWIETVCDELGVRLADPGASTDLVLNLAADVAHGVARPAAPVTAFLLGLAAGGAEHPDAAVIEMAARISALATNWEPPAPTPTPAN